jgi:hypothetical protein
MMSLSLQKDEIRILSLLPAPFDIDQPAPIECDIDLDLLTHVFWLREATDYAEIPFELIRL